MEFKTPEDKRLIFATAAFSSSYVHRCVEMILQKEGCSYEKKKTGWDEFYEIRVEGKSDAKVQFFLYNLYLEIATKDRDIKPLEWDTQLLDFSFFKEKMADVIYSKIRPLLVTLSTDDAKEMDEKLTKLAKGGNYAHMRMGHWDKGGEKKDG